MDEHSRIPAIIAKNWTSLVDAAMAAASEAATVQRELFRSADLGVETKADNTPVTEADRRSEELIRETLRTWTPELGIHGEEFGAEGSEEDRWIIDPIDGTANFIVGFPYFACLIGLQLEGELVLGVVHAPALGDPKDGAPPEELGKTWWAVKGAGAHRCRGLTRDPGSQERLRVSETSNVEDAFLSTGSIRHFRAEERWKSFLALTDRVARVRGFGDWWGHVLVAEGICDAMLDPLVSLHDVAAIKPIVEEAGGRFGVRPGLALDADFADSALSSNSHLADPIRKVLGF